MYQAFDDFDDAINFVVEKMHECKFILTDGLTAINAVYGARCGQLVETGAKSFPTLQGFIARLDWNQKFADEINEETLRLAETRQLESLEDYKSRKNQACAAVIQESGSIDFMSMRMFFICSYGACIVFAIHMIIIRQQKYFKVSTGVDAPHPTTSAVYNILDSGDDDSTMNINKSD